MTHTLQWAFSPWWLIAPAIVFLLLLTLAIWLRRFLFTSLAVISIIIVFVMIVAIPASRTLGYQARLDWAKPITTGDGWRVSTLCLEVRSGGICLFLNVWDLGRPGPEARNGNILARLMAIPHKGYYPRRQDRFSITKSDFIQNKLGFQICWWNGPDPDGSGHVGALYAITMPVWLVSVLSLILPAWWLKRHLRQRRERRRGFPVINPTPPAAPADTPAPSARNPSA